MRNYTEHTYLEQRTVQALTHVKCDKCGKEIGTFNLDNLECNGDIKYTGYGDDKAPYPKVWYLCRRIQNAPYDMNRGYHSKDFDICPDCFVSFMNEFKEFCGNDSDNMEMFIKHMVEYEHGITEISSDTNTDFDGDELDVLYLDDVSKKIFEEENKDGTN